MQQDCSEVPQTDDVYAWDQTDRFHVLVSCSEECCGPTGDEDNPGSSCSTQEDVSPDTNTLYLYDFTDGNKIVPVLWEVEEACGSVLVSGEALLEGERRYRLEVDAGSVVTFEVEEEIEGEGCSIGSASRGRAPLLFPLLALGGLFARRRRN